MNLERLTRKRKLQKINKEGSVTVTLPKEQMELLDWCAGQEVIVSTDGSTIMIRKEE